MRIDGIPGETVKVGLEGWIEVTKRSIGIEQAKGVSHSGGGGSASRAIFNDLRITKRTDKASPKLAIACASGKRINSIIMEYYRADASGAEEKYALYTLKNCIVTSWAPYSNTLKKLKMKKKCLLPMSP